MKCRFLHEADFKKIVSYVFLGLLLLIAIHSIVPETMPGQMVLDLVGILLVVATIVLGVIMFYLNRNVLGDIEEESQQEEIAERKREAEFTRRHPKINLVWGVRWVARWMYKEGWWYSWGLVLIVLIGFGLRIFLSTKMVLTIDECYTHFTSLGWIKYHQISTTISGAPYTRTTIYNLLNTIPYYFINHNLLKLRIFNIILFSIFFFLLYIIIKNSFLSKKVALLSLFLISINWYSIATTITARSYTIFIILSFVSLYLCYLLYHANDIKNIFKYFILILLSILINLIEGHSLALHIMPLFLFVLLLKYKYFSQIKFFSVKKLILGILIVVFITFYTQQNFLSFIIANSNFNFSNPYLDGVFFQGSILSYINIIGIILLVIVISSCIVCFINNKKIHASALFSLYILLVLMQPFIFGNTNSYPRYLSDLTIPIIIIISFFLIFYTYNNRFNKIIAFSIIMLIVTSSAINIHSIYKENLAWSVLQPEPWQTYLKNIPQNATIITDFVGIPFIYRPDLTIYALRDNLDDQELVDINYNPQNEMAKQNIITTEKNIILFNQYVKKNIFPNHIVLNNQQYLYYSGTPKVMSVEHLKMILEHSNNQEVYIILSHNAYEKKNQRGNKELYEFIFNNSIILDEKTIYKNPFDNRVYNTNRNNNKLLSLIVIKKNSI